MIRRLPLSLVAAVAAAVALAGCGGGGSASLSGSDVAVVGSEHITRSEYDGVLRQAQASYKQSKRKFPKAGSQEYQQVNDQIMTILVQKAEYSQEASDMGIEITDKKIDQRLAEIKKQYFGGSEKRYQDTLKAQGLSEAQVRADVKASLIGDEIQKRLVAGVTDAKVKAYYDSHKSKYAAPATREVRHILVKKKSLAEELYKRLQNGADFAALAKKYSTDTVSAKSGGKLLPAVSKGQTVPPFDKAVFSLKTKEISKPVHSTYGWHIIQPLADVKPPGTRPFTEVKASIKAQLDQEKLTSWRADLVKRYKDKIRYAAGYAPATTASGTTTG
jgi:foldase protein PrsA